MREIVLDRYAAARFCRFFARRSSILSELLKHRTVIMTMPFQYKSSISLLFVLACLSFLPAGSYAQTSNVQPRITEVVNDSQLTVLHGNTHPLARPQFDRGPAPSDLPMERIQLVLQRGPDQEAALEKLMAEQQDRSSPNYHKWLTPNQFGQEFGPADQDIQTITSWLRSHGFQINNVSNGRTIIQFTGTAGQVQEALHTPIHKFVVGGEEHWANANDPSIPTALTPVVVGVATLHNFYPKPTVKVKPGAKSTLAGKVKPQVTIGDNGAPCGLTAVVNCFGLGPADFATIYNVQALWNAGIDGTGETIAVVSDSNINPLDVTDFRTSFGLPANAPVVTVPPVAQCTAPGLNGDEVEAILDVEWSGAVAKNATIDLVTCASTSSTFGGDLAAGYIVDFPNTNSTHTGSSTGFAPILSESFGECELGLGSAENAFYNTTWQQAAGEGITVLISTGDNGSASCDTAQPATPTNCGFSASAIIQVAQCGLAVSGIASTPFNVAVGGTEFNDVNDPQQFWSPTNAAGTFESALSYIPETTYNDSCTSPIVVSQSGDGSAEAACNDPAVQDAIVDGVDVTSPNNGLVTVAGGSGGASNCTTFDGTLPADCTGGYPKPSWQIALTPADGKRDLPDISLFAGDGTISGSFYVLCERDENGTGSDTPCSLENGEFLNAGGTSVSTQVFAGIMALVDQKNESSEGLINPVLYTLAATAGNTCTSVANPSTTCVFYDIADGSTNAMPCITGSLNCLTVTGGDPIGVLTGFTAGGGYDLATGLGSVNVANLVNAPTVWNTATSTQGVDFTLSLTDPASPPTITTAGGMGTVSVTVTGENGFAGVVALACSDLPSGVTCSGPSVTGSGQSTITFTSSGAAILLPVGGPDPIASPGSGVKVALVCALSLCLMLIGFSAKERRLSLALVLVAFALVFANVGCGGGGGTTPTPPGTPVGTNVVITATSGSIHRSVAVLLTVTN
jgi:subtilase family serine protease